LEQDVAAGVDLFWREPTFHTSPLDDPASAIKGDRIMCPLCQPFTVSPEERAPPPLGPCPWKTVKGALRFTPPLKGERR